jgi:hypothetical protein
MRRERGDSSATDVMGQDAHELVSGVVRRTQIVKGRTTGWSLSDTVIDFVRLGLHTTDLVAGRWIFHEPMAGRRGDLSEGNDEGKGGSSELHD